MAPEIMLVICWPLLLVGYRGTGKSAVGRHLASALGWSFTDMDAFIEAAAGKSIAEVFRDEGENGFRDRETELLAEAITMGSENIIATGGGVVLRPTNRELIKKYCRYVAWLTAAPEEIWSRLQADPTSAARRPNLTAAGGLQEVRDLLAVREPLYREVAHATFPTDGRSPEQVADAILAAWTRS